MMRVLLDNNVSRRFSRLLVGHEVTHVTQFGWENLKNGLLLAAAEESAFDVLITADKQIQYQQNILGRRISIVVLNSLRLVIEEIAPLAPQVLRALDNLREGVIIRVNLENNS
jgi:predicted nuclease of predicted toxin-antitoxin system